MSKKSYNIEEKTEMSFLTILMKDVYIQSSICIVINACVYLQMLLFKMQWI